MNEGYVDWSARSWCRRLALAGGFALTPFAVAAAQNVVACNFEIADNLGINVSGKTLHLVAAAGGSSTSGIFELINPNTPEADVDHKGYSLACNYTKLYIAQKLNLINVDNNSLSIPAQNVVIENFPKLLPSGSTANVGVFVDVPINTVAGRYVGSITVRDSIHLATATATEEPLNLDGINVEVTVLPNQGFTVLSSDHPTRLDSLVIAARSGAQASSVWRVANTSNTALNDIQIAVGDLQSESAVNLTIPSSQFTLNPPSIASLLVNDTARITIRVNVPRGILGGRYRGTLLVGGQGAANVQVPLIVVVSSSRGILFENNPLRTANSGAIARIAFNGDPGTTYKVAIFDMAGLLAYTTQGTVFAGCASAACTAGTSSTTTGAVGPGADYAVSVSWPLVNGRGENVASGMYLVVVESIVSGQRQLAQDKLIVIR